MITTEILEGLQEAHAKGIASREEQIELARVFAVYRKVLRHLLPPETTRQPFICGEAGEVNMHGVPDMYLVCPEVGADIVYKYKRDGEGLSPGW